MVNGGCRYVFRRPESGGCLHLVCEAGCKQHLAVRPSERGKLVIPAARFGYNPRRLAESAL
ncbi:hypothetical protein HMPREF9120_00927 [Neisseria sp. oral taxon 020 str. F0370]|nr:hypothetical protein HMPREF9120_00927 [Neisseria sp. oral taxon 020 str. F0370]